MAPSQEVMYLIIERSQILLYRRISQSILQGIRKNVTKEKMEKERKKERKHKGNKGKNVTTKETQRKNTKENTKEKMLLIFFMYYQRAKILHQHPVSLLPLTLHYLTISWSSDGSLNVTFSEKSLTRFDGSYIFAFIILITTVIK